MILSFYTIATIYTTITAFNDIKTKKFQSGTVVMTVVLGLSAAQHFAI